MSEAEVLKYYNPNKELTLQCDVSEKGLGAVLTHNGHPVAFASRGLTKAQLCYAQIGKELVAVVFGLEKFQQYTFRCGDACRGVYKGCC